MWVAADGAVATLLLSRVVTHRTMGDTSGSAQGSTTISKSLIRRLVNSRGSAAFTARVAITAFRLVEAISVCRVYRARPEGCMKALVRTVDEKDKFAN